MLYLSMYFLTTAKTVRYRAKLTTIIDNWQLLLSNKLAVINKSNTANFFVCFFFLIK